MLDMHGGGGKWRGGGGATARGWGVGSFDIIMRKGTRACSGPLYILTYFTGTKEGRNTHTWMESGRSIRLFDCSLMEVVGFFVCFVCVCGHVSWGTDPRTGLEPRIRRHKWSALYRSSHLYIKPF